MDKFLGIYLNDQLAAGMLWREIARRSQRNNSGTELGEAGHTSSRAVTRILGTRSCSTTHRWITGRRLAHCCNIVFDYGRTAPSWDGVVRP